MVWVELILSLLSNTVMLTNHGVGGDYSFSLVNQSDANQSWGGRGLFFLSSITVMLTRHGVDGLIRSLLSITVMLTNLGVGGAYLFSPVNHSDAN